MRIKTSDAFLDAWPDQIAFSTGDGETNRYRRRRCSSSEFIAHVSSHSVGVKVGSAWSPFVYTGDKRCKANCIGADVMVLDIDKGATFRDIRMSLSVNNYAAAVASTHSHCRGRSKFRIIVPLVKPFAIADYASVDEAADAWKNLNLSFAKHLELPTDPNALLLSQYFYDPRHPDDVEPVVKFFEGRAFDAGKLRARADRDESYRGSRDRAITRSEAPSVRNAAGATNHFERDGKIDYDAVRSATMAIKNDERFDDRPEWIKVCGSLDHATESSVEGLEIWLDWCATWTGGDSDEAENERVWKSMRKDRPNCSTAASLVRLAKRDGWTPPDWIEEPIEFTDVRERKEMLPAHSALRFYYPSDLHKIPDASYLVKSWLFQGQLSAIYGQPGAGKTFFALDIALHIANGWPWFGCDVKRGVIIYIALEGVSGIRKRAEAWCKHHGGDLNSIPIVFAAGTMDLCKDVKLLQRIVEETRKASDQFKLSVQMIFVDTLARALHGGDENSSKDMGALIAGADKLRELTGAHVCLVHHEGKDSAKGMRGSSALLGAVDTAIAIGAEKNTATITNARLMKQKEDEGRKRQKFALESVRLDRRDEDGNAITSAVVVPANGFIAFEDESLTERERAAAQILHDLLSEEFREDDGEESSRAIIPLARWKSALHGAGWVVTAERTKQRIKVGQSRSLSASASGQEVDEHRTRESFDRAFRRLRERLENNGTIQIVGDKVGLALRKRGQRPDKIRAKRQIGADNRTTP